MKNHRAMSGLQFIISVAILMALLMSKAEARLVIIDEWAANDTLAETVTFNIQFNNAFDIAGVDDLNRAATAFQYYIGVDLSTGFIPNTNIIITSAEMYIDGQVIVRNGVPTAAGWGPITSRISPTVNGSEVSFTVPWSEMETTDGKVSYALLITEFGGTTDEAYGMPIDRGICHGEPVNVIIEVPADPIDPAPVDPVSSEPIVINVGPDTDPNPDVQNRTVKINGGGGAGWGIPVLLLLYLGANINRYYRNNRANQV